MTLISRMRAFRFSRFLILLLSFGSFTAFAQDGGERSARDSTPEGQDPTGNWVSVVTQHWHYRMRMPPEGATAKIPLNETGRRILESYDPEADIANGHECRAYGAANIMRIPGRLHIHWADDNTLQIDTDSGMQTRLLQFDPPPAAQVTPSLQGRSAAAWVGREGAPEGRSERRSKRSECGPLSRSLHISSTSGAPAEKRRSLQRQHDDGRTLLYVHRAERRRMARRNRDHQGPGVLGKRARHQQPVQERAGRFRLGSNAV